MVYPLVPDDAYVVACQDMNLPRIFATGVCCYKGRLSDSGACGLMDMVFAFHAESRGLDTHRWHMSERFFRSNRPGYLHPVCSELENSGTCIRVAVGDCGVTERRRGVRLIKPAKLYMCTQNTIHTEVLCLIWFRTQGRWPN